MRHLREEIVTGRLAPGTVIKQAAIARYRQIYDEARAELESAPPSARWSDFHG
jgi:hypothetical protein